MDNRVIDCLKKGLDKGENAYFFYGDYIHDWYMYDLYHGICDMKNTLKRYFLENDLADYFFYCKNDIFEASADGKWRGISGYYVLFGFAGDYTGDCV